MNRIFLCCILTVPIHSTSWAQSPSSVGQSVDSNAKNEAAFFVQLLTANNGKAFCIPPTAKVGEVATSLQQHLSARGQSTATQAEMIGALAAIYPCAVRNRDETVSTSKDIKEETRLYSYLFSREQIGDLYNVGMGWDKRLGLQQGCKSQYRVKPTGLVVLSPITLPAEKEHPMEGAWKQRFEFERCNEVKIYNAIFVSRNGQRPEVRPYHPGSTSASLQLVADSMRAAVAAASRKMAKEQGSDCKDFVVSDMSVTQPPHDVLEGGQRLPGVWKEKWSFLACGKPADVFMEFVPDGKGGTTYITRDS